MGATVHTKCLELSLVAWNVARSGTRDDEVSEDEKEDQCGAQREMRCGETRVTPQPKLSLGLVTRHHHMSVENPLDADEVREERENPQRDVDVPRKESDDNRDRTLGPLHDGTSGRA